MEWTPMQEVSKANKQFNDRVKKYSAEGKLDNFDPQSQICIRFQILSKIMQWKNWMQAWRANRAG